MAHTFYNLGYQSTTADNNAYKTHGLYMAMKVLKI